MLSKPIIALFFILIIACSVFSSNIISLSFYFNQNYIANTLCENRNKPQMHCNGKCQLQKKLNQQENKDKQMPDKRNESHVQVFSSKSSFAQLHISMGLVVKNQFYNSGSGLPDEQPFPFFHPPQYFFI